jgi:hypothetical protein
MTTRTAQIVGALVALLQAGTPVAQAIFRARVRPLSADTASAVVVRVQTATITPSVIAGGPMDITTQIAIECYVRSRTGTDPDVAVDALLSATYARVLADTTLGGLATDVLPQAISYDFDADGEQTTCATLTLDVLHRSQNPTLD